MVKTYVPTLARLSLRLSAYITKHQAALNKHITDAATRQALTDCLACLNSLAALLLREQP